MSFGQLGPCGLTMETPRHLALQKTGMKPMVNMVKPLIFHHHHLRIQEEEHFEAVQVEITPNIIDFI